MKFYKVAKSSPSAFFGETSVSLEDAIRKIRSKVFGCTEDYKVLSKVTDDLSGYTIVRAKGDKTENIECLLVVESKTHISIAPLADLYFTIEEIDSEGDSWS